MKLRNKISGEIKEFSLFDGDELQGGATLESLTKEWEYICYICGKKFNLYEGEGWGESYMDGGMLPKTRYVCLDCIKKRKFEGGGE